MLQLSLAPQSRRLETMRGLTCLHPSRTDTATALSMAPLVLSLPKNLVTLSFNPVCYKYSILQKDYRWQVYIQVLH